MGRRAEYTLLITNPAGSTVVCDPIEAGDPRTGSPGWSEIKLGPRLNEAGAGTFTCTARPDVLAAVNQPDNRVVALREAANGDGPALVEMAGPIELPKHGYQASRDGADGPGLLTVTFADDLVLLAERLVYPDPALSATAQTTTKYTITNVNPEDAARALVDLNAGAGAPLTLRRTPGLVLGPDNGILPGTVVSTSFTRDTVLSDAAREVVRLGAVAAGTYPRRPRLRIIPANNQLQFVVEMPPDLSASVVFSRDLGSLSDLGYEPEAPTDTVAIVGDATAGVGRVVRIRSNTDAHTAGWRRREVWVDARGAANATELDQAGDEALAEGGPKTRLTFQAVETPSTRYGYDYPIGSVVSVEPYAGAMVSALVMGADLVVTPKRGEEVTPIVGVEGDQIADRKAAEIRRILRRLAQLEGAL